MKSCYFRKISRLPAVVYYVIFLEKRTVFFLLTDDSIFVTDLFFLDDVNDKQQRALITYFTHAVLDRVI